MEKIERNPMSEDKMREALAAIEVCGSDTLSGRVDGPADTEWYREAVVEMTKRATTALAASPAEKRKPSKAKILCQFVGDRCIVCDPIS